MHYICVRNPPLSDSVLSGRCVVTSEHKRPAVARVTVVYRTVASNGTCDSVRRVIAYLGFGFQVGHLFILFFFIFFIVFDYNQPVWMLAETRLDNNCSLVIAKCWRNGLLVGRDFKTQWTIAANIAFSLRLSVRKMYFPIIFSVKTKTCLTLRTRKPFPSSYTITI